MRRASFVVTFPLYTLSVMQGQAEQGNYSGQGQQRLSGGPSLWPEHQVKDPCRPESLGENPCFSFLFTFQSCCEARPSCRKLYYGMASVTDT